ncbi:unnamed protein product [Euphydryas editha]|uniref:Uncharacterized protein n=1 Tax=Euphydryas editha TaxID=104508 RepID=A0AAU9TRR1_EUPED|nr:unnamed protein product [Euphydryas editha]
MKLFLLCLLVAAVAAAPKSLGEVPGSPVIEIPKPEPIPSPNEDDLLQPEIADSIPAIPTGEVFNDGLVQVTLNASEDAGYLAYLQSWFSMILNYFNGEAQVTHQIV